MSSRISLNVPERLARLFVVGLNAKPSQVKVACPQVLQNVIRKQYNATRLIAGELLVSTHVQALILICTIMATRKRTNSKRGPPTEHEDQSVIPAAVASKLPKLSTSPRNGLSESSSFPLLVVLSMGLSSALYAFSSPFTSGDLSTVSAHRDQWGEVAGLLAWRATELAVGWYGGFDSKF